MSRCWGLDVTVESADDSLQTFSSRAQKHHTDVHICMHFRFCEPLRKQTVCAISVIAEVWSVCGIAMRRCRWHCYVDQFTGSLPQHKCVDSGLVKSVMELSFVHK